MESDIDLGEDDGLINLSASGVTVQADLWRLRARLADNHRKNRDAGDEAYLDGVVKIMEDVGLPRVSQRMAQKFAERIYQRADQLKKESSPSAALPASTGSTPGA
jgi:hypothetical protein